MTSVAYRVSIASFPDFDIIVGAPTRGQAKNHVYLSVTEAGYKLSYLDINARRAPEFDDLAKPLTVKMIDWKINHIKHVPPLVAAVIL